MHKLSKLAADGHALGSLCVLDTKPRDWTDDDLEVLRELAAIAMHEIEMRQLVREAEEARRDAQMRLQEIQDRAEPSPR